MEQCTCMIHVTVSSNSLVNVLNVSIQNNSLQHCPVINTVLYSILYADESDTANTVYADWRVSTLCSHCAKECSFLLMVLMEWGAPFSRILDVHVEAGHVGCQGAVQLLQQAGGTPASQLPGALQADRHTYSLQSTLRFLRFAPRQ